MSPTGIPDELKRLHHWVGWRWERRGDEWTKVPINTRTRGRARPNSRQTWGTFEGALEYAESERLAGVGFVFSPDDPFVGVDLDDCRDPNTGRIEPWATEIIEELDSYAECSPSGTGIHVLLRAQLPDDRSGRRSGQVEIYHRNHYFTMTGLRLPGVPQSVNERQDQLDALYVRTFAPSSDESGTRRHPALAVATLSAPCVRSPFLSDDAVTSRARSAFSGAKFARLFDHGETSAYGDDDSRADQALCSLLALQTPDPDQIDRIFRRSKLYRDKWERADYRHLTIAKALTRDTVSRSVSATGTSLSRAPITTLDVIVGSTLYRVEDPRRRNGLEATVTALAVGDGEGVVRHRDRIHFDLARERQRFAAQAGTDPDDLNAVRDTVLRTLDSGSPVGDAMEETDEATKAEALGLLDDPDLLGRVREAVRALGYAGDPGLPVLIFLVLVSRLLERPINLVVTGPSASGKSYAVMLAARLVPARAVYMLNGMSERVLVYTDADLRHRVLVISEAAALHREGVGASLLRSVAWEGRIAYETVEKTNDGLKARRLDKPGPTGFITTTTAAIEPELETRVLTVQVSDTKEATRVILRATGARANGHAPEEPNLAPWHEAQRWLEEEGTREVTIPFAHELADAYPADQVRSRRDFTQVLNLVRIHAVLHQRQRGQDGDGRILADERDYRAVYDLTAPVFGAIAAEGVTDQIREAVHAVRELVETARGEPVQLKAVCDELHIDMSSASRRVRRAIEGGWLVNEEDRKGRPLKLRLGEPLPDERPALPDPASLFTPTQNSGAIAQPHQEFARAGAEIGACMGPCTQPFDRNHAALELTGVAQGLQTVVQPRLSPPRVENDAVG